MSSQWEGGMLVMGLVGEVGEGVRGTELSGKIKREIRVHLWALLRRVM
jgi:hypothetical protein